MGGNPPDYDNQRYGGPSSGGGIRYPQEAGPGTFALDKETDINVGGAGTTNSITLTLNQTRSSYYYVSNAGSGATTINWPAVLPGVVFTVFNSSGQACTFKVAGQTGVSVANAKHAILAMDKTAGDIVRVTADT
jgi:hypothetical protein